MECRKVRVVENGKEHMKNAEICDEQPQEQSGRRKCPTPNCPNYVEHEDGLCTPCHIKSYVES